MDRSGERLAAHEVSLAKGRYQATQQVVLTCAISRDAIGRSVATVGGQRIGRALRNVGHLARLFTVVSQVSLVGKTQRGRMWQEGARQQLQLNKLAAG